MSDTADTLTVAEAAQRSGYPEWQIARWASEGKIPGAVKTLALGRIRWLIPPDLTIDRAKMLRVHSFPRGTPWRERVSQSEAGCLEWQGRLNPQGYGVWGGGDKPSGSVLAHRIVYTMERGEIPTGLQLDHLCRNPPCVNPDHLEPVTARENLLRSPLTFQGQNAGKTHCIRGHAFDDENTYRYVSKKGYPQRACRACRRGDKAVAS